MAQCDWLQGHKNAVLEVHWLPSGEQVMSCSADRTVRVWDASVGSQIKKYKVWIPGGVFFGWILTRQWANCELAIKRKQELVAMCNFVKLCVRPPPLPGNPSAPQEHTGVVNGVAPLMRGPQLLASASDDCTARLVFMCM
jgi:WD40 repeat protein